MFDAVVDLVFGVDAVPLGKPRLEEGVQEGARPRAAGRRRGVAVLPRPVHRGAHRGPLGGDRPGARPAPEPVHLLAVDGGPRHGAHALPQPEGVEREDVERPGGLALAQLARHLDVKGQEQHARPGPRGVHRPRHREERAGLPRAGHGLQEQVLRRRRRRAIGGMMGRRDHDGVHDRPHGGGLLVAEGVRGHFLFRVICDFPPRAA